MSLARGILRSRSPARGAALVSLAAAAVGLTQAGAQAQSGEPAAIIEAIEAATITDLGVMDFVYEGTELALGDDGAITLSYLRSCRVEQITGGIVKVGARRSEVDSPAPMEVMEVPCGGGGVVPTDRQRQDAAGVAFRSFTATDEVPVEVYGTAPVFVFSQPVERLALERVDPGATESFGFQVEGARLDLAEREVFLKVGGVYRASAGEKSVLFRIVRTARREGTTIVERLVGF